MEHIKIEKGEFVSHDWQRTLKIRKPYDGHIHGGISAFVKGLDMFHVDAFKGTEVESIASSFASIGTRKVTFDAIDWVGNVIGQIDDCPWGPTGRTYLIHGLGVGYAFYTVSDYCLDCMPDGSWCWTLSFTYNKEMAEKEYKNRLGKDITI